jgi:hypothetical protein
VGEITVDDVVGPDGGSERAHLRIDAADAGDEEVGVGEIEARVEAKSHDSGGSTRGADTGEDAEDSGLWIEAEVVIARGKGEDGVEVLTLNPVLILAGSVAGVGTDLEHVDDDYFDFDGLLLGLPECR